LCRYLKYPFAQQCGCPDPNYLEYLADRDCDANDSCRTLIVYGCMDTSACNYNADANFHIQSLCCYPGLCNDRDISVVCPGLNYKLHGSMSFNLFPVPAHDQLAFQSPANNGSGIQYAIYNCLGKIVGKGMIGASSGPVNKDIDVSFLEAGVYIFKVENDNNSDQELFIKD